MSEKPSTGPPQDPGDGKTVKKTVGRDRSTGTACGHQRSIAAQLSSTNIDRKLKDDKKTLKETKAVGQDRSTGTACGHQRSIAAQSSSVKTMTGVYPEVVLSDELSAKLEAHIRFGAIDIRTKKKPKKSKSDEVEEILEKMSAEELKEQVQDGKLKVTWKYCVFCGLDKFICIGGSCRKRYVDKKLSNSEFKPPKGYQDTTFDLTQPKGTTLYEVTETVGSNGDEEDDELRRLSYPGQKDNRHQPKQSQPQPQPQPKLKPKLNLPQKVNLKEQKQRAIRNQLLVKKVGHIYWANTFLLHCFYLLS